MKMPSPNSSSEDTKDLADKIIREIQREFSTAIPSISDNEMGDSVRLMLRVLRYQTDDKDIGAVGRLMEQGLAKWFEGGIFDDALAKNYEPFLQLLLSLIRPGIYQESKGKGAGFLLKRDGLGLCDNRQLEIFARAKWLSLPSIDWTGQPYYLKHLACVYVRKNDESHRATIRNKLEQAQIIQSFCVVVVYVVYKHFRDIHVALIGSHHKTYLELIKKSFESEVSRSLDLVLEPQSGRSWYPTYVPSRLRETEVSCVPMSQLLNQHGSLFYIAGEAGSGKTILLKYLAWKQACELLDAQMGALPVYLDIDLIAHRNQTIERAIEVNLWPQGTGMIPWEMLVLLLDGLDHLEERSRRRYTAELHDLVKGHPKTRVVIVARPEAYLDTTPDKVWVLQSLNDDQIITLIEEARPTESLRRNICTHLTLNRSTAGWLRIPSHARLFISHLEKLEMPSADNFLTLARRCIRGAMRLGANARYDIETSEAMLAKLAFAMKSQGGSAFTRMRMEQNLMSARIKIGASSLDVQAFLAEAFKHGLLKRIDEERGIFTHEFILDYLTATELGRREAEVVGVGVSMAISQFGNPGWIAAIRYFAALTCTHDSLIRKGAEKNPPLAWLLWLDSGDRTPDLAEVIAESAHHCLSSQIRDSKGAHEASRCLTVLASLGRPDCIRQGMLDQWKLISSWQELQPDEASGNLQPDSSQAIGNAFFRGISSLFAHGAQANGSTDEEALFAATAAVIDVLEHLKAWRVLVAALAGYTGSQFCESRLVPGRVLNAIINVGIDTLINDGTDEDCAVLVRWLERACRSGFAKAWTCYGRAIRLLRERNLLDGLDDTVPCDDGALVRWLRNAHESGDTHGSLELARWLLAEPNVHSDMVESLTILQALEGNCVEARCMLGEHFLSRDGDAHKAAGLRLLLSAVEDGDKEARYALSKWWFGHDENLELSNLPDWAGAFSAQLKAFRSSRATG